MTTAKKPAAKSKPAARRAAPASGAKTKRPKTAPADTTSTGASPPAPQAPEAAPTQPPGDHPGGDNYVRLPRQEPDETFTDYVRRHMPFVVAAYTMGHSLAEIGESFDPQLTGMQLRTAIAGDAAMHRQWVDAKEQRAHFLVEEATRAAMLVGIAKERAETLLKVAEKTAPHLYGPKSKVELSGPDDGPIESKVEMTPTEAYMRMVKG